MLNDTNRFLKSLPRAYFDASQPVFITRAPGRLDVMGGISDYSGGLCLEWPLECATHCAIQRSHDDRVQVLSANAAGEGWPAQVTVPVAILTSDYKTVRARLSEAQCPPWALYVLGAFVALHQEFQLPHPIGARIFVDSDVPIGAGVSSSAALEVAAMQAVCAAFGREADGLQIARLAQRVENQLVGAPCGIMDQITSALGRADNLIRLLCQPDIIEGYVPLPDGVAVFGIDSNVRHSVGGAAYGRARCAAFMGRRILQGVLPAALKGPDGKLYLANLASDVWRAVRGSIPERMTGAEFIKQYGSHGDMVTTVEPEVEYPVRLAMEHPIYERDRTRRFAALLGTVAENDAAREPLLAAAGDLMIQSHFSYDHRCNLGSPETDVIVKLARERGPKAGILGAKITGGGAGGTAAILADVRRHQDMA
ncbi:MAG TPA: galactokinase family protein, partial [Abditibacteriaceae bacterium]|nr:galactokinase family protein [Abditibacteriaceae bacterium]